MDGKIQFHQKNPYLRFDLSNSFFLLSVSLSVGIVYEYEQNLSVVSAVSQNLLYSFLVLCTTISSEQPVLQNCFLMVFSVSSHWLQDIREQPHGLTVYFPNVFMSPQV